MSGSAGALLGLVMAIGVLSVAAGILAHRRPRLAQRLASRDRRQPVRERGPLGVLAEIMQPDLRPILSRLSGDGAGAQRVRERLQRAGLPADVTRHRLERILWGTGGVIIGGVAILVLLAGRGAINPLAAFLFAGVGAGIALLLHDRRLTMMAHKRAERMDQQLPNVAELLAFAVAAGEPPIAALERVGTTAEGELAGELEQTVADVRGGTGLIAALQGLSRRSPSPAVVRFVDGIVVATERGTPMAEVLRSQAADARAAGHRRLMETSAKREVLMLTPVVFLVLPIVVIIALYPGIHGLNLTVP
jgi:tight adherence protein C